MSDNPDSYETFEYFEGTKVIQHPDGSTTYVQTTHEPYVEPLTPKQTAAVLGATVLGVGAVFSLPFIVDRVVDWSDHRKEIRALKRKKKLDKLEAEAQATTENN